jgi:hypothetical protein
MDLNNNYPLAHSMLQYTLENTEETIKNGQSRENGNMGYTGKTKQKKHNAMCAGHHYVQANTNNVNKT